MQPLFEDGHVVRITVINNIVDYQVYCIVGLGRLLEKEKV